MATTANRVASRITPAATPQERRCECGHLLHVYGIARHRIYFEPANVALDDPVMDHRCPGCGREL